MELRHHFWASEDLSRHRACPGLPDALARYVMPRARPEAVPGGQFWAVAVISE
jgi:hypothetical protein